jgi:predicted acylesterase/phospholipase RssA
MAKKLAIVISGAVSLGSYEAGVTYEVLEAIAQHNESALPDEQIEIDVITGASAGGITAAVLGKSLLCHGPSLREPYKNPLYQAWVEKVKMVRSSGENDGGLLEVDKELHKYSLLNVEALDRIGKEIFPDDFQQCPKDCKVDKPHPAASKDAEGIAQVMVGIAMGNLNGFPLSLGLNQGLGLDSADQFSYSQYKDNFVLRMMRPAQEQIADLTLEEWGEYVIEGENEDSSRKLRWGPRREEMSRVSWSQLREVALSSGAFPFAFGVLQIERHIDQSDTPEAIYSSRDSSRKAKAFQSESDPFVGKYIYTDGGVFENEPVGLAISLIESLYPGTSASDHNRYFLFIAPGARQASSDPFRTIKKDHEKTDPDHLSVAKALVSAIMGQSRFQQWITHGKGPKVLAITSEDGNLLGDVFSAFGGFLDEKFRAYDYNIGRQTAQDKLRVLMETPNSPIQHFKPKRPTWPPTPTLRSAWMPDSRPPLESWEAAIAYFGDIAKVSTSSSGQRNQIDELNRLLDNVDPATRRVIRKQILDRVRSLVGYVYEEFIHASNDYPSQSRRSPLATVVFWTQGAWALIRGPRAMEKFIADQVDRWLDENVRL